MALGWRSQYYRYKDLFLNVMAVYKKRADLRMFMEIILSLTTVTIFLLFALKPTAVTIIGLIKEIDQKKATVAQLDKKISDLATARNVYTEIESAVPIIESSVPVFPEPDIFVAQMQGIANKNSVKLLGLSVGEITLVGKDVQKKKNSSEFKPLAENAKEMSISISVSGDYTNLTSFVRDLENSRRPIRVDVLGINSSQTESGQIISIIISGRVPFLGKE